MKTPLSTLIVAMLVLLAPAAPASADEGPKVLFVPHGSLPFPLRDAVARALGTRARILSTSNYTVRCQRANERPSTPRAIQRIGTRMGADVIAVASWAAWGRSRVVRMTYRHGRTGRVLLQTRHTLPGVRLDTSARRALAREAVMTGGLASDAAPEERPERVARAPEPREEAQAARAEPRRQARAEREEPAPAEEEGEDGLPPPLSWEGSEAAEGASAASTAGDEEEPAGEEEAEAPTVSGASTGFGLDASGGFGFGARSAAVPMEAGPARLSTSPFPAAMIGLGAGYDAGTVTVSVRARYLTSVGLRTKDIRSDGTTRTVDARAQSLHLGIAVELQLNDAANPTLLELGVGYQFRLFHTEVPVSMPEYTLSGIYARADLSFGVGSGPLRLAIAPEVASVNGITEQLQELGQITAGFAVGAEAAARVQLLDELRLEVVYRESHAFIGSERDTDMTDVERFGVLRATYVP